MNTLKGYRTILIGLAMAVLPPALTYLGGLDWTKLVGPNAAMIVSGIVMVAMRAITNTAPGQKG